MILANDSDATSVFQKQDGYNKMFPSMIRENTRPRPTQ